MRKEGAGESTPSAQEHALCPILTSSRSCSFSSSSSRSCSCRASSCGQWCDSDSVTGVLAEGVTEVRVHRLGEPRFQPTQGFPTPYPTLTNPRLMQWLQLAPATPLADTWHSCFQTRKLKLREGTAPVQRPDTHGEFPGGPAVRMRHFHCCGLGSISGPGTEILKAITHGEN